jgi:hypothetical protein
MGLGDMIPDYPAPTSDGTPAPFESNGTRLRAHHTTRQLIRTEPYTPTVIGYLSGATKPISK